MATMRDVAARAGVSAKTVSRVCNADPHVAPQTRARVEAALRELDYLPTSIATTFRTGRAPVIGVAVPDIVDPFFAAIAGAVAAVAAAHGMSVVMTSFGDDAGREAPAVQFLLRQALSGLVIAPVAGDHSYLRAWGERTRIVFVDRRPEGLTADSFTVDDTAGGHLATAHLIAHGHSRIAFLGDDLAIPTTRDRLAGHRAALRDAGITADDDRLVVIDPLEPSQAAATLTALDAAAATALFCSNARAAMSLAPHLRESGLAVACFGDFPMAGLLSPAITVVDQDPDRLGTLAAQRILDRISEPGRRRRRHTVLPVELIERESCRVAHRARRRVT